MTHRTPWLRSAGLVSLLALAWAGAAIGCGNAAPAGSGAAGTGASGSVSGSGSAGTTGAGGSAPATCSLGGESCAALPCCSGLCTGGMCVCTAAAGNCQSGAQCCSGVCASGVCAPCNGGASLCTENANCCSGICNAGVCGSSTFSCDVVTSGTTSIHECSEYTNLPAADLAAAQSSCAAAMGTPGTACSMTGALGFCTVTAGALTEEQFYYTDGTLTAAEAQMACTGAKGTWTPG
jgi:hypothetical protein